MLKPPGQSGNSWLSRQSQRWRSAGRRLSGFGRPKAGASRPTLPRRGRSKSPAVECGPDRRLDGVERDRLNALQQHPCPQAGQRVGVGVQRILGARWWVRVHDTRKRGMQGGVGEVGHEPRAVSSERRSRKTGGNLDPREVALELPRGETLVQFDLVGKIIQDAAVDAQEGPHLQAL